MTFLFKHSHTELSLNDIKYFITTNTASMSRHQPQIFSYDVDIVFCFVVLIIKLLSGLCCCRVGLTFNNILDNYAEMFEILKT